MKIKRTLSCLASVTALLAAWVPADAAIIVTHRGNSPNALSFHGVAHTSFDIDGNGVADFVFSNSSGIVAFLYSEGENRFVAIPPRYYESGGHAWHIGAEVIPLEAGSLIGRDVVFSMEGEWHGSPVGTGAALGYAASGPGASGLMQFANAYIGVEFRIGENIHYGWIHYIGFSVGFEHGMPPELPMSVDWPGGWINTWAYNSIPGAPIHAGQIPEPSAPLLAGIAAVAAMTLRQRKQS